VRLSPHHRRSQAERLGLFIQFTVRESRQFRRECSLHHTESTVVRVFFATSARCAQAAASSPRAKAGEFAEQLVSRACFGGDQGFRFPAKEPSGNIQIFGHFAKRF